MKTFYVTTPIYYVNDRPHIGSAYTTIACDVLARFHRLDGARVFYLTGTDEHGQKVAQSAAKAGMAPQDFTDKVSQNFRDLLPMLGISNDDFIRTTESRHKQAAQALWTRMEEAGDVYQGTYAGWYAQRDEAYYAEDELKIGPNGEKLSPFDSEVQWMEEKSYFFRLSTFQDRLLAYYEQNPQAILPESRRNEVLSFVRGGLKDLAISRSTFEWGVPVPNAPKHVMYVWVDALTNYLTALGYPDMDAEKMTTFWPKDLLSNPDHMVLHMLGKDILRFHAVYWPAFLMSAGLPPPKRIFAHGWLNSGDGRKMSKSWGNVIWPEEMVSRFGVEGTRYALLATIPFGNDGNVHLENITMRLNNDLANNLGNLAQRTLSFIAKNAGGQVPTPGSLTTEDQALLDAARTQMIKDVRSELEMQRFDKAIEAIQRVATDANIYIDAQAPWTLKKTDPVRMGTVLYVLADVIRCLALAMQPLTPKASAQMLDQLAVMDTARTFAYLNAPIAPGTSLPAPTGVYPRIELQETAA